jgi:biopolymer transport protein ExbD
MGFSNGGGGGRGGALSEINVTPLVDVMLVLLIIFMVAAPMLTTGVEVDLPKAEAPRMDINEDQPIITVQRDQRIFLFDQELNLTAPSLRSWPWCALRASERWVSSPIRWPWSPSRGLDGC